MLARRILFLILCRNSYETPLKNAKPCPEVEGALKKPSELRQCSIKVARPSQILGGGVGGGKNSGNFPISQNSNFARKNSRVGTPATPLPKREGHREKTYLTEEDKREKNKRWNQNRKGIQNVSSETRHLYVVFFRNGFYHEVRRIPDISQSSHKHGSHGNRFQNTLRVRVC